VILQHMFSDGCDEVSAFF